MFVVVDIAVLAQRFFIGNHFRRAGGQGGSAECSVGPKAVICRPGPSHPVPSRPSRPVRPVLSCPCRPVRVRRPGRRWRTVCALSLSLFRRRWTQQQPSPPGHRQSVATTTAIARGTQCAPSLSPSSVVGGHNNSYHLLGIVRRSLQQ